MGICADVGFVECLGLQPAMIWHQIEIAICIWKELQPLKSKRLRKKVAS